ncbi:MAG: 5'-nucleotidase C-terminal domain-containing protein, partial [Muribaculaceae bacterium]|nr:5'-nucleotidase C-terminal domain-containing protein [Muribaculaceae bacterium]
EIVIDLDSKEAEYKVIPIDKRLDDRVPQEIKDMLKPYRTGVDSLMTRVPVGKTKNALAQHSPELLNWATDFVLERALELDPDVDFAIVNKGGLRRGLPKGTIHEGQIITMMPFNNLLTVIDIKGKDLMDTFEVMARADGNGVSKGVEVVYIPGTAEAQKQDAKVVSATLNGEAIDPERTYRIATIDYLANGGDYMTPLKNHTVVTRSHQVLYKDLIDYLRTGKGRGKIINPSSEIRMHP